METVFLYLLGIAIVVVGLALSIGLHEIGHLVPAKLFGVRVGQYMIGFGPTLFSRRFGETEYGVKAIPMGGYISMSGMYPPAKDGAAPRTSSTGFFDTFVQEADQPAKTSLISGMVSEARAASAATVAHGEESRTFYSLPIVKRVIIMLGGPLMNLVIGIVLYAVVLSGFGVPQASTTVGSVSACVIAASSARQECVAGDPEAPGAAAGILPGDTILRMNGTKITSWTQATEIIRASAGKRLDVVLNRNGADLSVAAYPLLTERYLYDAKNEVRKDSFGTPMTEKVGFMGIGAALENARQPLSAVLPAVGDNITRVGEMILTLPQRVVDIAMAAFGPGQRDPNGPISVVGVGRLAGEITSLNTIPVLDRASSLIGLLASLNIALFVFNLVPLLPLDGGHVAGALWEGIRRFFAKLLKRPDPGPIDTAKFVPLTLAVVAVLAVMSLLLIYADIVKPISIL